MIVEFRVTNFGSIRDTQTLSMLAEEDDALEEYYVVKVAGLRLLKMALLYGPNASGKTMVLKALECLRNLAIMPKTQKSEQLEIHSFYFDPKTRQAPTIFKLVFIQNDIRYNYEVEVNRDCVLRERMVYYPHGRPAEIFSRKTDIEQQTATIRIGSKSGLGAKGKTIIEGNTLWNNTVIGAFEKLNVKWPDMFEIQRWFKDILRMMITPEMNVIANANKVMKESSEYKSLMVTFLEKADVQISDVNIIEEEETLGNGVLTLIPKDKKNPERDDAYKGTFPARNVKIKREQLFFTHEVSDAQRGTVQYELPADYESSGTLQYYGLAAVLALLIKTKKINLIDEIESALHPDLLKHFLLMFLANAQHSQLILTTHNVHLLDEKDILRKDAIWFTQKRGDGSTELYSLADFDSSVLRKNASILNAYRLGKLGATPNTGSIFIPAPAE